MEIVWVLGVPLAGSALLGLFGHRRHAPEINIAFSFGTLVAAAVLVMRVIDAGPLEAGRVLHIRGVDGNTLQVSVAAV